MTDASMRVARLDLRDDAVALAAWMISRAAYQVEVDVLGVRHSAATVEPLAQMRQLDLCWLGSHTSGGLVGVLGYRRVRTGHELLRLAVDPRRFRTGVASGLIAALPPTPAITVRASVGNAPALALYARLGFVPCGESMLDSGLRVKHLIRRGGVRPG